jgi:hypothetical protein
MSEDKVEIVPTTGWTDPSGLLHQPGEVVAVDRAIAEQLIPPRSGAARLATADERKAAADQSALAAAEREQAAKPGK